MPDLRHSADEARRKGWRAGVYAQHRKPRCGAAVSDSSTGSGVAHHGAAAGTVDPSACPMRFISVVHKPPSCTRPVAERHGKCLEAPPLPWRGGRRS